MARKKQKKSSTRELIPMTPAVLVRDHRLLKNATNDLPKVQDLTNFLLYEYMQINNVEKRHATIYKVYNNISTTNKSALYTRHKSYILSASEKAKLITCVEKIIRYSNRFVDNTKATKDFIKLVNDNIVATTADNEILPIYTNSDYVYKTWNDEYAKAAGTWGLYLDEARADPNTSDDVNLAYYAAKKSTMMLPSVLKMQTKFEEIMLIQEFAGLLIDYKTEELSTVDPYNYKLVQLSQTRKEAMLREMLHDTRRLSTTLSYEILNLSSSIDDHDSLTEMTHKYIDLKNTDREISDKIYVLQRIQENPIQVISIALGAGLLSGIGSGYATSMIKNYNESAITFIQVLLPIIPYIAVIALVYAFISITNSKKNNKDSSEK